jgi:hypothetical protein
MVAAHGVERDSDPVEHALIVAQAGTGLREMPCERMTLRPADNSVFGRENASRWFARATL